MSTDFEEEFDLVKILRQAQALEMVNETDVGWETKVIPDALAQKAADEIIQLRQQVNELRNELSKKSVD
jgi:hypothetical protein